MEHYIYVAILFIVSITIYVFFNNVNEAFRALFLVKKTQVSNYLSDSLNKINNEVKKHYQIQPNLIKSTNKYFPETVPKDVTEKLEQFMKIVMSRLNCQENNNLILTNYKTIIVREGMKGNKHYLVDILVYDTSNDIMNKLTVDLFEFSNGIPHINSIRISNWHITEKDLDYPNKINTQAYNLDGVEQNNTLDYTNIKTNEDDLNKKINIDSYNNWIVPKESIVKTEEGVKEWPCALPSEEWDTNGIQKNKISKQCNYDYNRSTNELSLIPTNNPTVIGLPRPDKEYGWLFNLSKGIPSFPSATSLGSGSKNIS
jgi:hypothetical protein